MEHLYQLAHTLKILHTYIHSLLTLGGTEVPISHAPKGLPFGTFLVHFTGFEFGLEHCWIYPSLFSTTHGAFMMESGIPCLDASFSYTSIWKQPIHAGR